eukprot:TRINITY_DN105634_c0_g1_i1.p1 TRINITY_DN105634_c0_g1~~TRINITY_DN105634_c0_g1_i1.p1  ORF type:complete len:531 (-),score=128.63 TRINITY_DN105634_c0_g1_i1:25-1617(-)
MAASKKHAMCAVWLLISALALVEAKRSEQTYTLSSDTQGTAAAHALAGRGSKQEKGVRCPEGLTPDQHEKVCYSQQFEKSTTSSLWSSTGSDAPLVFQVAGGVYMVESQFLAELAVAFTDETMKLEVANSLAEEEMRRNSSFRDLVSQQAAKEHGTLHNLKHDLEPGFFILEHTAEHLVLEGLAIGFHALEHAAHTGAVIGGASMEVFFGVVGQALHFVLAEVLPILIPIQAAFMAWQVRKHYKHETHHAKNFTAHLVLKSDCMIEKLENYIGSNHLTLKASIPDMCTADVADHLEEQIQRTMSAQVEVFQMLASIGRCLWPHNQRAWSKIGCVESLYFKVLQHDGKSGILYSALSFMAYYGYRVDELLEAPYFGQWYQEEFGIGHHAEGVSLLPKMLEFKDKPLPERLPICMQLMATHRAFERTFVRLKDAVRVWMQSFSRTLTKVNMRSSWLPCKRVFFKASKFEEKGVCKNEDWHIGHGALEHTVEEDHACERAADFTGSLWPETTKKSKKEQKEKKAKEDEEKKQH